MSTLKEIEEYTGEVNTGFTVWLCKVASLCEKTFGLGIFDLPDMNYRDEYEDGCRPTRMLALIIDYNS